jgi:integrase/recombinase XerD
MLEQFFNSHLRIQALRNSPSGGLLEGFAQELGRTGYSEIIARKQICAAEHFLYWTSKRGIPSHNFNEQVVQTFSDHLRRCRCPGYGHANCSRILRGVRSFVGYVNGNGVGIHRAGKPTARNSVLLAAFEEWMRAQRGTSTWTLYKYSIPLHELLDQVEEDLSRLDAQRLRQFVFEQRKRGGCATTKNCTTALRMFLRYLIAEGKCSAGLDEAIPVVAHWRLSSLPRYLQDEEVERVIAACDLNSPVGKRDHAILLLLARLGFRAGDIIELNLADIDWKGASITVSGKSKREATLPLTQEVGNAIVEYVCQGRPQCDSDVLFVRARAPFRPFANHCAISVIVKKAMRRAGVKCQSPGAAHVLRHSAATSMLRHGASLQDIAAVLRHRSIDTTQIYAKVDVISLLQITQPWPEVKPC